MDKLVLGHGQKYNWTGLFVGWESIKTAVWSLPLYMGRCKVLGKKLLRLDER